MRWYRSSFGLSMWGDPGPCPVDDAPHTTCTSPDYGGGGTPIVIQQLPARDAMTPGWSNNPVPAAVEPAPPPVPVSTKTYRRHPKIRHADL